MNPPQLYPPVLPTKPKQPKDVGRHGEISATYGGVCPCGAAIVRGDKIVCADGAWYHEECRP